MKKNIRLCFAIGCVSLLFSEGLRAQTAADTGKSEQMAIANAKAVFDNAVGEQSALYNGPAYFFYNPTVLHGTPYFLQKTTSTGNVFYDGVEYKGIQLLYDLYKDELVTPLYDNTSYIALIKSAVQNFDLPGHHFININADTLTNNTVIPSGYYDELYHGRLQVLERTTISVKQVNSSTGTMEAFSTFAQPVQSFFIRKNNVYYSIGSEGSLLDVLKDQKKQVKNFIKTIKIKFRKDPGAAMAAIAAFYDRLSN